MEAAQGGNGLSSAMRKLWKTGYAVQKISREEFQGIYKRSKRERKPDRRVKKVKNN